jgi:hypothetical protein
MAAPKPEPGELIAVERRPQAGLTGFPKILTANELGTLEAAGERVRGELARLIRALPPDSRSVRTMAAFLDVDRNTCQRVVAAAQPGGSGAEVFVRLPGLKALRALLVQCKRRKIDPELLASLYAASERVADVLREFEGSQQRLRARIEATLVVGARAGDGGELGLRRALFDDHARLLKREMAAHCLITAVCPQRGGEHQLEQAWVRGLVGLRMQRGAAPLPVGISAVAGNQTPPNTAATIDPLGAPGDGRRSAGLIASLSSVPLPTLTSRGPRDAQLLALDAGDGTLDRPFDVAIGTRVMGVEYPERLFHTSAVISTPAARLVFDVYVHRSIAVASVPSSGVFLYTMSFSANMDENWPFRLPGQYRLELLGAGTGNAESPAWSRHADATAHLFEQTGWRADDFVGHRMDIEFPMWGSAVYQWFEFGAGHDEP